MSDQVIKVRAKRSTTEAIQWTGSNAEEVEQFASTPDGRSAVNTGKPLKGEAWAELWDDVDSTWIDLERGDYIVRVEAKDRGGPLYYSLPPAKFEQTFEEISS